MMASPSEVRALQLNLALERSIEIPSLLLDVLGQGVVATGRMLTWQSESTVYVPVAFYPSSPVVYSITTLFVYNSVDTWPNIVGRMDLEQSYSNFLLERGCLMMKIMLGEVEDDQIQQQQPWVMMRLIMEMELMQ